MLAKNIKKLRKKQKLSQEELAKKAGITYSTLIKIESGANDVDFQIYSPASFRFIPHFFPLLNYRTHPAEMSTGLHKL